MAYFQVTKPLMLNRIINGLPSKRQISFDPAAVDRRIMVDIRQACEYTNYTTESGELYHKQHLNLSEHGGGGNWYYWLSDKEAKSNDGLVEFLQVEHRKRYRVLRDVRGNDNCYNNPRLVSIKKGSIIKLVDEYCTYRGDRFFTIVGDDSERRVSSYELMYSPAPQGDSYYNPMLLEPLA